MKLTFFSFFFQILFISIFLHEGKFCTFCTSPNLVQNLFSDGLWVPMLHGNEQGELAASYRWTGWGWEIASWSSRLQEKCGICLKLIKKLQQMLMCNWLELETLGSPPIMPKNFHGHWFIEEQWHWCSMVAIYIIYYLQSLTFWSYTMLYSFIIYIIFYQVKILCSIMSNYLIWPLLVTIEIYSK